MDVMKREAKKMEDKTVAAYNVAKDESKIANNILCSSLFVSSRQNPIIEFLKANGS